MRPDRALQRGHHGGQRAGLLADAPNALASLVPRDADLARYLRVPRVADAAPGKALHLVMDGEAAEALCWLE